MQILQNYSRLIKKPAIVFIIVLIWFCFSYYASQFLVGALFLILKSAGIQILSMNEYILNAVTSFLWYSFAILIMIGAPWVVNKKVTNLKDLGLGRYLSWTDILMTPVGFIGYIIITLALMTIVQSLFPGFDANQAQDVGFGGMAQRYEYVFAFLTLVVIAPIAEELIFRGYLYGKLRKVAPVWMSVIVVSVAFGILHGAWNLAFDTFALSIILCLLREFTGSIGSSILLHMTKNGIAYFFLFIAPLASVTIK